MRWVHPRIDCCNFHAEPMSALDVTTVRHPLSAAVAGSVGSWRRGAARWLGAGLALLAWGAVPTLVWAEKADRTKPMVVEADKPGTVDMQRQLVTFSGNVVIVQGTMQIRAERVEVREVEGGRRSATAIGSSDRPATYRQKREGLDETIQGSAERIEYDGRTDTLRFVGQAVVRRLRGAEMADEITGRLITWDNTRELFNVEGGAVTPDNPTGRVRAILSPSPAEPASAATPQRPAAPEPTRPSGPGSAARPAGAPR